MNTVPNETLRQIVSYLPPWSAPLNGWNRSSCSVMWGDKMIIAERLSAFYHLSDGMETHRKCYENFQNKALTVSSWEKLAPLITFGYETNFVQNWSPLFQSFPPEWCHVFVIGWLVDHIVRIQRQRPLGTTKKEYMDMFLLWFPSLCSSIPNSSSFSEMMGETFLPFFYGWMLHEIEIKKCRPYTSRWTISWDLLDCIGNWTENSILINIIDMSQMEVTLRHAFYKKHNYQFDNNEFLNDIWMLDYEEDNPEAENIVRYIANNDIFSPIEIWNNLCGVELVEFRPYIFKLLLQFWGYEWIKNIELDNSSKINFLRHTEMILEGKFEDVRNFIQDLFLK